MLLLYEFPDRYDPVPQGLAGAVDGLSWLTKDRIGPAGEPVPVGAALHVRGWAPNLDVTGPATNVIVTVDGTQKHHARLGKPRPDLARRYDDDAMAASGFEAIITTGQLAPGEHELIAFTVDERTRRYARIAQTLTFSVVADWTTIPKDKPRAETVCVGSLDEVFDESRGIAVETVDGSVTIPRGALLSLRGWFCDPDASAPFTEAYAIVDGERAYKVDYGSARIDAVAQFGKPVSPLVGFAARVPTVNLQRGTHQLDIVAMSADGETLVRSPISLQLVVGPAASARLPLEEMTSAFLDEVVRVQSEVVYQSGAPLLVAQGDHLFVRGWAIDEPAQSVAAGVVFIIDDRMEVSALYGLPRPDVAETLRNPNLTRCGFTVEIETEALAVGFHKAECRVHARDGRGAFMTAQRFDFEVSDR